MKMESRDKDIWYGLFAGISDETLPPDFNERVMQKIREEAASREKKHRYMEIFGYVSGITATLVACVLVFYYLDIPFEFPKLDISEWSFLKPDYTLFKSQSFLSSVYIGAIALFLLIVDSTIRKHIGKKQK